MSSTPNWLSSEDSVYLQRWLHSAGMEGLFVFRPVQPEQVVLMLVQHDSALSSVVGKMAALYFSNVALHNYCAILSKRSLTGKTAFSAQC